MTPTRMGRFALFGAMAVVMLGIAVVCWLAFGGSNLPKRPPAPVPNGYDTVLKAASLAPTYTQSSSVAATNAEALRALVSANEAALALFRQGLTQVFQARLDATETAQGSQIATELGDVKRLSTLVSAEGRLALLEGRADDALQAGLMQVLLGHRIAEGGVVIHAMMGVALEKQGFALLQDVARATNHGAFARVAAALEELESKRPPTAEIWEAEDRWMKEVYGLKGDLIRLVTFNQMKKNKQAVEARFQQHRTHAADMLLKVAARAYLMKHGSKPGSAKDLVPEFLRAVPMDPMTGQPMAYRPDYD